MTIQFQDLPVWVLSVLILIIMMGSLIACVCGCRRKVPRNELLGLAGVVKITDTDRYNAIEMPALGGSTSPSNLSSNASLRRAVSGAGTSSVCNARSLPDLPVEIDPSDSFAAIPNGDGPWLDNNESITVDNASELYATLEENKGTEGTKFHRIEEEYDARNRLNSTPYERIEGEHPYALVGSSIQDRLQPSNEIDGRIINVEIHNEEEVDGPNNDNGHIIMDILAASAISGVVPANDELPYMTPPIHENHFIDDSQDSTKGYTSITVREPIAMIQRSIVNNENVSTNRHGYYTAISDDSDEMYAAIVDPTGNIYNSGSETYAQIQPVVTNNDGSRPDNPSYSSNANANSSNSHSRQASSSSMSSCVGNQYSPKERRQANSPLPKPPPSPSPSLPSENRDNMYAKVVKRKKDTTIGCISRDSVFSSSKDQILENENNNNECEIIIKGYETIKDRKKDYELLENHGGAYETILEEKLTQEKEDSLVLSGYERIKEPGYEEISRNSDLDPNYEELRPQERNFNNYYATINKNKSNLSRISSEPDYASLTRGAGLYESLTDTSSSNDPNYEVLTNNNNNLQNRLINQNNNENDNITSNDISELYSKVNKHNDGS